MSDKPMCFVGMPCGHTVAQRLAYRGWQLGVLRPAIEEAGFSPWVSESDAAPEMIPDQILKKIVEAPMAVFDLGGFEPGDVANPNVMYELGIRHAYHRPAIVYSPFALPFDVQAGRAIIYPRSLEAVANIQNDLKAQIAEAAAGRFWKPLLPVASLEALLEAAHKQKGLDLVVAQMQRLADGLEALRAEVREPRPRKWIDFAQLYEQDTAISQAAHAVAGQLYNLGDLGLGIGRSAPLTGTASNPRSVKKPPPK